MSKYYAVKNGRKTGMFESWTECEEQVKGFSNAEYKSFKDKKSAIDYLSSKSTFSDKSGLIAYVDGSFNAKTKEYGYGCVIIENQKVIKQLSGKGNNEEYALMRNVAGEILGSLHAIKFALEKGESFICIYYDYEGIEKWATKQWKANKRGTMEYVKAIESFQTKIDISFIKVLAHSGDLYNEMADALAKKAVGIRG